MRTHTGLVYKGVPCRLCSLMTFATPTATQLLLLTPAPAPKLIPW